MYMYNCAVFCNPFASQDKVEILELIEAGTWSLMEGGWLDLALMYNGFLSGFLNG